MSKKNRRELLVEAGRFALAGAIAPILSSGASGASEAPAQSHDTKADEEQTEATAEKVIDALEGAYGVQRGQRRNHTKGVGALGSFVGSPEASTYSRSELFSGKALEVVARFSVAGREPPASDPAKSPRGTGLPLPGAPRGLPDITQIHPPPFFYAVPQTFPRQSLS